MITPVPKPQPRTRDKVKKIKTAPALHRELWEVFARYIKLRDCLKTTGTKIRGRCVSCGKPHRIEDLQAGHFITRRAKNILYDERNVNAQCENCNGRLKSNPLHYQDAMIRMYGQTLTQWLRAQEHSNYQWKAYQLQALIIEYRLKVQELEVKK